MNASEDITSLRTRLAETQRTLTELLSQPASGDAAQAQRIAEARAQIAALTAALRERGVAVADADMQASAPQQRTISTDGGNYAEGDLHQQGVFVQGGTFQAPVIGVQTGGMIVIQPPQPMLSAQERRLRTKMLATVRATWLPLLDETLQNVVRMDLGLASNAALVDSPRKRLRQPGRAERSLPPGTSIQTVFDDLGGELLILGAPGSGKTTILLELARALLDRAAQDDTHPIPVVFNLSSWAEQHPPLATWLVDELNKVYVVSRQIGQAWVDAGALLPLLDGLDEVALDQRAACVAAINTYHAAHGPLQLVVCSRSEEYAALVVQLRLQGAVVIQPLAIAQINTALARAGERLESVRLAIRDDGVQQELATTPLLLSVMIAAYAGRNLVGRATFDTLEARRIDLFAAYIDAMFARRGADPRYPRARTLHYLAWLARGMVQRNQTMFYIEQLQQDCLPRWQRWATMLVVVLSSMALGGIGGALIGALVGWLIIGLATGVRIGLVVGLIGGEILGLLEAASPITAVERLRWSWTQILSAVRKHWLRIAGVGLGLGLLIGVIVGRRVGLPGGLIVGLGSGAGGGLIGLLGFGLGGGLSVVETPLKATPNQGIRRSGRNALFAGLGFGLTFGLGFALVFGLGGGFVLKADSNIGGGLLFGLLSGLIFAMLGGMVLGLVFGFLRYGGLTCIKHLILRILIWRNGDAPWDYARFLDYAAGRILVHKVGGGYIFIHRMLLEYFAALPHGTAPYEAARTERKRR